MLALLRRRKLENEPQISLPEMTKSILQKLFFIHIVYFIIIIQSSLDLSSGSPQGSVFPGQFRWGYLRDIIDPGNQLPNNQYFDSNNSPNSNFLFLRNPNSLDNALNRDTESNRVFNNQKFDQSGDRFSGQFQVNTAKKPLFPFLDRGFEGNGLSGSSTRNNEDFDRVISDIIRVVPSRNGDNNSPNFASERPRSDLDTPQDNRNEGWTVLKPVKPSIIGATRPKNPTSIDETSNGIQQDNMNNRFNLLKPIKPLFNFDSHVRGQSLDGSVKKSGENREVIPKGRGPRVPGPPHPLNSIYRRGAGNVVSSSITTIFSGMIAVLMLYPLFIL